MKWLAKGKALRGSWLDLFGRTDERRMERALIVQFERRIDELLAGLSAQRLSVAVQIAALPQSMRGYGHVKIANVALARVREAELLHRYDPQRYPKPAAAAAAGQFRGIAVVSG
jgi:indolepyruvate ferredoxin oxidoreductase